MSSGLFPPQAYTREMLMQAYQWLRHQSESTRELATSPDALVSLYLKARRAADISGEAPPLSSSLSSSQTSSQSKEHFKNDLKSLASELKAFNSGGQPSISIPPIPEVESNSFQPTNNLSFSEPQMKAQKREHSENRSPLAHLDMKSYEMIVEIRNRLNLSSDTEVLRMLITVGYDRIKGILPNQ